MPARNRNEVKARDQWVKKSKESTAMRSGRAVNQPHGSLGSVILRAGDLQKWLFNVSNVVAGNFPSSIFRSQLPSTSLISDAPAKLWLMKHSEQRLDALYRRFLVQCTKHRLLAGRREYAQQFVDEDEHCFKLIQWEMARRDKKRSITAHQPQGGGVQQPSIGRFSPRGFSRIGEAQAA